MEEKELAESVIASLDSDKLVEAFAEVGDTGLDAFLESGALEGIPVFGGLAKIYKGVEAVGNYLFRKKVASFLFGLKETTHEQRKIFLESLGTREERIEFGETVLYLIDTLDDKTKAQICGRLAAAAIRGDCSRSEAFRTMNSVKQAFSGDFSVFKRISILISVDEDGEQTLNDEHTYTTELNALYSYGWTNSPIVSGKNFKNDLRPSRFLFYIQPIGNLLLKHGLQSDFQ